MRDSNKKAERSIHRDSNKVLEKSKGIDSNRQKERPGRLDSNTKDEGARSEVCTNKMERFRIRESTTLPERTIS